MKRVWVAMGVMFLAWAGAPTKASADEFGAVMVRAGSLTLDHETGRGWHPMIQVGGVLNIVGPLEAGAFLQLTGHALPLRSPSLGGGARVGVRPHFGMLRPALEIDFGYYRMPDGQRGRVNSWALTTSAALGVEIHDGVTVEARAGHLWLLPPNGTSLGHSAWNLGIGLIFSMP